MTEDPDSDTMPRSSISSPYKPSSPMKISRWSCHDVLYSFLVPLRNGGKQSM